MDQEVPGSRPGGGTITFNKMAFTQLGVLHFKPDIEPDRCALNNVHYRYWFLDLWVYFRHAPACLRIAANMFALARGYAAVCWLVPLLSAQGATQAGCGPAGSPFLFTHQFQAEPCRGSCRVATIVERIDLGCARSVMRVLISVTAPH